jgi:hypothetical protein
VSARKKIRRKKRDTVVEWAIGQPLNFPPKRAKKNPAESNPTARAVVEAVFGKPSKKDRKRRVKASKAV